MRRASDLDTIKVGSVNNWEAPPMKQYKKFNAGSKYSGVIRSIPVNISVEDIMNDTEEAMKRISDSE